MVNPPPRFLRAACIAVAVLAVSAARPLWAADWDGLEQRLVTQLARAAGAKPAALEVINRSSLGTADVEAVRHSLQTQLLAAGVKLANDPGITSIQVLLSENLQEWVWVGEVQTPGRDLVTVIVSAPRSASTESAHTAAAIALRKTFLLDSSEPILDAAVINGALARLAVLYASQIKLYRLQGDHWIEEQALQVTHKGPWPRDLRGRLLLHKDRSLEAHLPGVVCQLSASTPAALSCGESDDPWPIATELIPESAFFAASRNFFTGVLAPAIGKQNPVSPFYSAAAISSERGPVWLLSAVDGRVHVLDTAGDTVLAKADWGSSIAGIRSTCGAQWQILASGNGTGEEDSVRAYELRGREPMAVGQPAEFGGGVTSLWPAADGQSAGAVVHNEETGRYEAYLLTMACSQ
jgi:hypothetical protein